MPKTKKPKRMFLMLEVDASPDEGWSAKNLAEAAARSVGQIAGVTVLQTHVNVSRQAKAEPAAAAD